LRGVLLPMEKKVPLEGRKRVVPHRLMKIALLLTQIKGKETPEKGRKILLKGRGKGIKNAKFA